VPNSTNVFVKEIRQRIDTYFKIVLRNVRDTVPKQIGYFLVKMSQEKLQFELYQRVNQNQGLVDMLGEPKSITERRETLNSIIKTMDRSLKILQRDPE
jgi:vacuolar protein sorting-associated protein 1